MNQHLKCPHCTDGWYVGLNEKRPCEHCDGTGDRLIVLETRDGDEARRLRTKLERKLYGDDPDRLIIVPPASEEPTSPEPPTCGIGSPLAGRTFLDAEQEIRDAMSRALASRTLVEMDRVLGVTEEEAAPAPQPPDLGEFRET